MTGGPSASTSMSCDDIVVGDAFSLPAGTVNYDGMPPASVSWAYAGTVAGGTFVIVPKSATVVGILTGAESGTSLVSCEEFGASITSVTFTGAMTFVRV
jgi:hypothetical protein